MTNNCPRAAAAAARRRSRIAPAQPEALEGRTLFSGLTGTYFDNADLAGEPTVTRIDSNVSFNWQTGSPDARIGSDTFSARWVGAVRANYSEQYTFYITADDGARLWVNGGLLVDTWSNGQQSGSGKITLEAGRLYDIRVEHREQTGNAQVKLSWESASQRFGTIPSSMLYPPSTPATGAPQLVAPTPGIVNAASHGAVGTGAVDDAPALQRAIDATPAFGTLRLEPRTYKLGKSLVLNKPMNLEGNGALLLLNTSRHPENHHLSIGSQLTSTATSWSENVVAGQSTFHPTFAAGTFSAGQWVFVELGQDPYDVAEQHFTAVVPVTAVGANSVTLGVTVPHDIANGSFNHKITPLGTLATQIHVRDLKFDHVDGTIPDMAVWFGMARNSSIDGMSGRFNIGATVAESANISLRNINASLVLGHRSAGRVMTAWQSDNVSVSDVRADTGVDRPAFFVESWSRNTAFRNIDLRWRYGSTPQSGVFHLTGGSSGTYADGVRIENAGAIMLTGSGTQPAQFRFGRVSVTGAVRSALLGSIDDLTVGTRRYSQAAQVTRTIDLGGGWQDKRFPLVTGTIKSIKLTASHSNAVSGLFVLNAAGKGAYYGALTGGQTADLWTLGTLGAGEFPFDGDAGSAKVISLYTPGVIPAGARLTVSIEYYPA